MPFITNLAGFDEKSSTTRHLFPCGRCGDVGFEGRSDYAAIGAVTNLASRLADEATGGQMLITQRLYAEIEDHVSVEPAGEFALKGFRRPVTAFDVLLTARSVLG